VKPGTIDETVLEGKEPGWYVVAGPEANGAYQLKTAWKVAAGRSIETPHHSVHVVCVRERVSSEE
jgi:hypothetical protein